MQNPSIRQSYISCMKLYKYMYLLNEIYLMIEEYQLYKPELQVGYYYGLPGLCTVNLNTCACSMLCYQQTLPPYK